MGRSHFCPKDEGMNKGAWTAVEDKILKNYIKIHGDRNWRNISKESGLKRCGKSCRLRWLNYLRPDIKRGNISQDEEDLIIRLHKLLGNKWALIAGRLPGRTDNAIKNYWNTHLSKKAQEKKSNQPKNEGEKNIRPPDHEASPESGLIKAEASHKAECNDTKVALSPSMDCSYVKNVASESESSDKNLSEFTMDFSMGEICLTAILKPDNITKVNDFEIHDFNNNVIEGYDGTDNGCKNQHQISPFSDQEVLVYEEMEENWRSSSTDFVQAGMDYLDFGFLASFFEPADDDHEYWLGEDLTINVYPS